MNLNVNLNWTCTEDDAGSGRPVEVITSDIVKKVHGMLMKDRLVKVRDVTEVVGILTKRMHNILHKKLHTKKLCAQWMPGLLTFDQKRTRKDVSTQCLAMFKRNSQDF